MDELSTLIRQDINYENSYTWMREYYFGYRMKYENKSRAEEMYQKILDDWDLIIDEHKVNYGCMYIAYELSKKCNDSNQFIHMKGIYFAKYQSRFCVHIPGGTSIIREIISFFLANDPTSNSFFPILINQYYNYPYEEYIDLINKIMTMKCIYNHVYDYDLFCHSSVPLDIKMRLFKISLKELIKNGNDPGVLYKYIKILDKLSTGSVTEGLNYQNYQLQTYIEKNIVKHNINVLSTYIGFLTEPPDGKIGPYISLKYDFPEKYDARKFLYEYTVKHLIDAKILRKYTIDKSIIDKFNSVIFKKDRADIAKMIFDTNLSIHLTNFEWVLDLLEKMLWLPSDVQYLKFRYACGLFKRPSKIFFIGKYLNVLGYYMMVSKFDEKRKKCPVLYDELNSSLMYIANYEPLTINGISELNPNMIYYYGSEMIALHAYNLMFYDMVDKRPTKTVPIYEDQPNIYEAHKFFNDRIYLLERNPDAKDLKFLYRIFVWSIENIYKNSIRSIENQLINTYSFNNDQIIEFWPINISKNANATNDMCGMVVKVKTKDMYSHIYCMNGRKTEIRIDSEFLVCYDNHIFLREINENTVNYAYFKINDDEY